MSNSTQTCEFWPDDPSKCWTVYILFKFFSAVSLLGCLFIIITIVVFKLYQYFVQRLILFMSISAFIKVLSNLFSVNVHYKLCIAQAFVLSAFDWAELLWVCCITVNIIFVVRGIEIEKYEKWFHAFIWIFSVSISLIPFIGHNYGPAGMWCWIIRSATGLRFGTWYIPLLVVIVGLFLIYIVIAARAFCSIDTDSGFQYETQQRRRLFQDEVKALFAYPLIYFLFTLPVLIYRIDDVVHPEDPPKYILLVLSVITSPLLGGFNALAFAFYGETLKMLSWNHLKAAFLSWSSSSQVRVTHNYDVDTATDSQALLYQKDGENVLFRRGNGENYSDEVIA